MTITLNNLPSNANLLGYACTFQVGQGTHTRTYASESVEAKMVCEAATAPDGMLFTDQYPPNRLSRLVSASSKRFGLVWQAILQEDGKIRRNPRKKAKVLAYHLASPVVVLEVRVAISLPLISWHQGE